ncbi:expressed unknown protein [Seminavis robusta]|uniref:Uncharacterized protein n=1 Tax=Seminavis robusta TaxID=568900 RepID=A0A9N8HRB4_9STRA|nr:expressed unknown protein [Seminavis robusta]|eukprot:Sro1546_g281420.1 n/a (166) ;mRNA; f:17537-18034
MTPISKKNVTFGENYMVIFKEPSSECHEVWYSHEDFEVMKHDKCAETKEHGNHVEETQRELCCDEHDSPSKARRKNHVASILALQEEHRAHGVHDAKGLQMMSATLSKSDSRGAQERAQRDSLDAFQLHKECNVESLKAKSAEEYSKRIRAVSIRKHLVRPTRGV